MSLRDVLSRLETDCGLKREGAGWKARCPAHEDRMASLSIGQGDGGRVLLICFAGCQTPDVVAAMGLTEADLFEEKLPEVDEGPPDRWPTTATYAYEDEAGDPVYRVLRKTSPSGRKTFRQERVNGQGGWIAGVEGVRRVLYRLPQVLASEPGMVFVVEGEKDCDNLAKLDLVATTNVAGAGKWRAEYNEPLRGRDVVILPDNDKAGYAHAETVSKALDGIAKSVKVVRLPGLPEKGDVSDWLKRGGTKEELERLVAKADGPRQFFDTSANRLVGERRERIELGRGLLTFGVKFLNDALGGIVPRDLIIVGAKTGVGKTALATIAALANCQAGRRVHYFALEAEDREIERRMKFQVLAGLYYRYSLNARRVRFLDWYQGRLDDELGPFEDQADEQMAALTANLHTYYRIDNFTADDFCNQLGAIKDQTDLVILDHLHYVDSDDENENRGYKKIVKQIRDNALRFERPVIVVAHVRKSDRRMAQLVPDVEDFHGSSDVPKMATKAIMIAPDFETNTGDAAMWSTFIQVAKCRADSSVTRYVARMDFNTRTNSYERAYTLGRLADGGRIFEPIEPKDWPSWKSNASANVNPEDYQ